MHARPQDVPNNVLHQVPTESEVIANHDGFGVQRSDDIRKATADMNRYPPQGGERDSVPLTCLPHNPGPRRRRIASRFCSAQILKHLGQLPVKPHN